MAPPLMKADAGHTPSGISPFPPLAADMSDQHLRAAPNHCCAGLSAFCSACGNPMSHALPFAHQKNAMPVGDHAAPDSRVTGNRVQPFLVLPSCRSRRPTVRHPHSAPPAPSVAQVSADPLRTQSCPTVSTPTPITLASQATMTWRSVPGACSNLQAGPLDVPDLMRRAAAPMSCLSCGANVLGGIARLRAAQAVDVRRPRQLGIDAADAEPRQRPFIL